MACEESRVPTLDEVLQARRNISSIVIRTPLLKLGLHTHEAKEGIEIYLKLENLQPLGSFKIRASVNAIAHIPDDQLAEGVWTASAGNMAQGLALRARDKKIPCTVIVPDTAAQTKVEALKNIGAKLIIVTFDRWWQALQERTYPGVTGKFVHVCDDTNVMAGNGTIGWEIIEDLPDVDAIVIPWGGGGLTVGIASVVKALKPSCKIFAAEIATAAPLTPSLIAGTPQIINMTPSFVDGVGARTVFPNMLQRAKTLTNGALIATLEETATALKLMAERNRVIAEGAGAVPVACALSGKAGTGKIVCVISGGNIDLSKFTTVIQNIINK